MDGITWFHADASLNDLRILDLITSADMQTDIKSNAQLMDNTWSVTLLESVWNEIPINEGHYIYSPGTEWGGVVTMISHNTEDGTITVQGPTWRGLLMQKRIRPASGQGYRTYTNVDANQLIRNVIGSSYGSLITVTSVTAGTNVSASFRYETYAHGLESALRSVGMRLNIAYDQTIPGVMLSAKPVNDWSDTVEISQDYNVNFVSQIGNVELANHCLALGSGELADRTVLDVWRVGNTCYTERPASITDATERTVLLDYPNAEDSTDLLKSAVERLQETAPSQSITVDQLRIDMSAELGDKIPVRDRLTGLTATSEITSKILNITDGITTISVKVSTLVN